MLGEHLSAGTAVLTCCCVPVPQVERLGSEDGEVTGCCWGSPCQNEVVSLLRAHISPETAAWCQAAPEAERGQGRCGRRTRYPAAWEPALRSLQGLLIARAVVSISDKKSWWVRSRITHVLKPLFDELRPPHPCCPCAGAPREPPARLLERRSSRKVVWKVVSLQGGKALFSAQKSSPSLLFTHMDTALEGCWAKSTVGCSSLEVVALIMEQKKRVGTEHAASSRAVCRGRGTCARGPGHNLCPRPLVRCQVWKQHS